MSKETGNTAVRRVYEFIRANDGKHNVQSMCRLLGVARSGYYAWLNNPKSNRAREDERLLKLIRASFKASQGIYGAPRVFLDLREAGETCSKHRVARIMRDNGIRALPGYRTRRYTAGKPAELIPDLVKRKFDVSKPNRVWVTDITYVRTWEGWLYLAIVMDLFSRKIIGWATRSTMHRELVLDAVLMAVRCRRLRGTIIHSDQGSQYGSDDWRRFCRSNKLEPSMSRRGNCWDNAVAESFFGSLKKERIKKRIYRDRRQATNDISDYIESFYNPIRRHQHIGGVSPDAYEQALGRS
ncbi:MAG TPA: IS3 family transposase [Pirellulaceae bacterium]|nr:IS3 family transposase [Pirellulaceae bacterium]